ncbi:AAA family ATPase, partial [Parabacteroides goldsteinii]|uniref:AAA family ATPase n=1 Tax=Parabacteroides goldsteinii TaxID=328812 RepID=UPI00273031E6
AIVAGETVNQSGRLSTIEAYFQGKRELFKGLAIEKLETDWLEYPVLHLDLNAEKYTSIEALTYILERHINGWEDTWGKDTRENSLSDRFIGVITRAYEKTGRQVVVLIDEYDKPLLQVFNDEKLQTEYLKTLKAFYGVLKSADRYLRFVFNPFSLLNTLSFSRFGSYWFQTGTPTFLVELLKQSEYDLRTLIDGVEMKESAFSEYRVAENNPIPLIYQSGYLTIKDYDERFHLYTLRFPNDEVKYGFLDFITPFYTSVGDEDNGFYIGKFVRELESGDVDSFLTRLKAFFADFPYELNDKTERHYQVVFYLVFKQMGQFCDAEVRSARGCADAVVKTQDSIYIFEFKLNGSAEAALKQINDKGYLIPYMADNRKQIKVGVMFDASERNIGQWLIEE